MSKDIRCRKCGVHQTDSTRRHVTADTCAPGEHDFRAVDVRGTKHAPMNPEQEGHLALIKDEFRAHVDAKYRAGQREHGGNLFDLAADALIAAALDEAVDQFVYLLTLRDKLRSTMPATTAAPVEHVSRCQSTHGIARCTRAPGHDGNHADVDTNVAWPQARLSDAVPRFMTSGFIQQPCHDRRQDADGAWRVCSLGRGHLGPHHDPSESDGLRAFSWVPAETPTEPDQRRCRVCRIPLDPTTETTLCNLHRTNTNQQAK